jgi:TPP-dependent pyruvate/acetoin dehydrogenase alpha subunit
MYRRMARIRQFEIAVARLIEQGEMRGAAHLSTGQEAAIVGACLAVRSDDYMVGTHRSHGHPIGKGAEMKKLMAELLGRRTGVNKGKGGSMHLADFSIGSLGETSIVGSGLPIATGGALSAQLRGTDQVVLAFFGEGATNEGTFHESMNLAAIWKLPVIFYCENNQYAVTTAFTATSAAANVADWAPGYRMPGQVVDGQDPIACWKAVSTAAAAARSGRGPSLVEAKTYRYVLHSQGRHVEHRSADEVASWTERDPLILFRTHLVDGGVASIDDLQGIEAEVQTEIEDCVAYARNSPFPQIGELYDDLFAQ